MALGALALPRPLEGRLGPKSELLGGLESEPLLRKSPTALPAPAPPAPPSPPALPALPALPAPLAPLAPQLLQGIVRAGRGASDPLTDVRIFRS